MDYVSMYFYTAIAGVSVLLFVFRYLSRRYRSIGENHSPPPEAGGAWPIVGHLNLLRGNQLVHKTLGSLADRYGPIFTIRLGRRKAIVVSSSQVAKEIFTTHDIAASSRPQVRAPKYLAFNYAMLGFSPYGPYWRELRKITSRELLSKTRLEQIKHIRISETETSIRELYNKWNDEKKNGLSGGVLVDMKKWLGDLTSNLILRTVVGKRYFGDNINRDDEKDGRLCHKVLRDFNYLMAQLVTADVMPWLGWVDIGGFEKAMKIAGEEMDTLLERWLQEHRRKEGTGEANNEQDFMDVLLPVVDSEGFYGHDSDTIVKATCMALISGGGYSTAITSIWAVSLLLNNRNILRKAQEELDTNVGNDRRVDEADIGKLPYLQAIVKETLRLYPPAPLSAAREFTQDCIISGYHVPKGTSLMLNLWKLHRDSNVWANPLEFKPERFLTTYKGVNKGHDFEIIPFGAGRRICPAITFSLQILHLVLANFLHAFKISTPVNEPVDMTESAGMTDIKATPLDVLVAPRLASCVYY